MALLVPCTHHHPVHTTAVGRGVGVMAGCWDSSWVMTDFWEGGRHDILSIKLIITQTLHDNTAADRLKRQMIEYLYNKQT